MKRDRPLNVPLSQQALRLLELMKPISRHREHIFPSERDPKSHTHPQTANMAIKRMGFHGRLVAHGLRALASTTLNEQGFDADVIESALSHAQENAVRAAYNRAEYLDRRREMMEWWSAHIEKAAEGNLSLANRLINIGQSESRVR
jgi:integrase